jgi:hypothetical protein
MVKPAWVGTPKDGADQHVMKQKQLIMNRLNLDECMENVAHFNDCQYYWQ